MSELPAAPRNAKALLVKAETYEALRQAAKNQLIPDEEDFITQTRNGKKFVRLRAKYIDPNMDAPPCPFGKVVRQEGVLKLVGGVVFVGETNLTLASIPLSTTANTGHWLYLSIVFTANHADNTLLPGVESSRRSCRTRSLTALFRRMFCRLLISRMARFAFRWVFTRNQRFQVDHPFSPLRAVVM